MELCALDLKSGNIRRVSTVGVDDSIQAESPEKDLSFSKFDAANLPEVAKVEIKYTNIDFVGHTNNKEYIRFILNSYSVRELEERPIKEMDIVYINQTYENDVLMVQKDSDKDRDLIAIKKTVTMSSKAKLSVAEALRERRLSKSVSLYNKTDTDTLK